MTAYVVANVRVENPAAFEEYRSRAGAIIARYEGRVLVAGGAVEVIEGDAAVSRVVILEFADREAAHRFYDSPEYQAILPGRLNNAQSSLFLVEGV
jgi:uncharacterized protein (DUF1330 family)